MKRKLLEKSTDRPKSSLTFEKALWKLNNRFNSSNLTLAGTLIFSTFTKIGNPFGLPLSSPVVRNQSIICCCPFSSLYCI